MGLPDSHSFEFVNGGHGIKNPLINERDLEVEKLPPISEYHNLRCRRQRRCGRRVNERERPRVWRFLEVMVETERDASGGGGGGGGGRPTVTTAVPPPPQPRSRQQPESAALSNTPVAQTFRSPGQD